MPSKASKLLEKARRSRGDWKRNDLEALYKGYGFLIDHGAKHDIVYHEQYDDLVQTLPRHRKVQRAYVKKAVELIDRLLAMQEQESQEAPMNNDLFEKAKVLAARPYPVQVSSDPESDPEIMFLATNPDLDGCMAQGSSEEEALNNLADARIDYIYFLLKRGKQVPEPSELTPSS